MLPHAPPPDTPAAYGEFTCTRSVPKSEGSREDEGKLEQVDDTGSIKSSHGMGKVIDFQSRSLADRGMDPRQSPSSPHSENTPPARVGPGFGPPHTPLGPSCRARLWRELRDVGQVGLLRGKGRAMAPQVWAIRQQGRVTHKGRVSYQGDSFGLTAEVGNPSVMRGT